MMGGSATTLGIFTHPRMSEQTKKQEAPYKHICMIRITQGTQFCSELISDFQKLKLILKCSLH